MIGYIDPGAGSLFLQALAAGAAGVAVVARLYWARIKRVLGLGRRDASADERAS
jgi:hypothetical protein